MPLNVMVFTRVVASGRDTVSVGESRQFKPADRRLSCRMSERRYCFEGEPGSPDATDLSTTPLPCHAGIQLTCVCPPADLRESLTYAPTHANLEGY